MVQMPLAKNVKYNPQADIVAGRTASQIQEAKRRAVGGKRKRCIKGKSCSAACIAASKVCMVDIPWVLSKGISKVVKQISNVKKVDSEVLPKKAKGIKLSPGLKVEEGDSEDIKKLKESYNKLRGSIAALLKSGQASEDEAIRVTEVIKAKRKFILEESKPFLKDLEEQRKAEGTKFKEVNSRLTAAERKLRESVILAGIVKRRLNKMPENTPEQKALKEKAKNYLNSINERTRSAFSEMKAAMADKKAIKNAGSSQESKGSSIKLPSLDNTADFVRAMSLSNKYLHPHLKELHDRAGGIYSGSSPERDKVVKAVGGESNFNKGVNALRDFTSETYYKEFRAVQRKAAKEKILTPQERKTLERARDAEKLLEALPKESVIKYRGAVASNDKLAATIAASKNKGDHSEGALASWSTSLRTSAGFADKADEIEEETGISQNRVVFRTVNTRGASVDSISEFSGEDEITTPSTAKYKHTGDYRVVEYNGDTYHVFDVEEY